MSASIDPTATRVYLKRHVVIGDSINHLVDVYPQVVGLHVDIAAVHVNDTEHGALVHSPDTRLWPNTIGRPQARALSGQGQNGLSPESTDPMTTDEVCN